VNINDKLSKEENLALAEARQNKAIELMSRVTALRTELSNFICPHYYVTKSQKVKALSFDSLTQNLGVETRLVSSMESSFRWREVDKQRATEAKEAKERAAVQVIARDTEFVKCIEFLVARGKKLGIDYTAENAMSIAIDIRMAELIVEAEKNPEPMSFEGQNCEDCSGWIPGSHRCMCGNRRVSWTNGGNTLEGTYIYPEAY
jgi:hypothetical protein